MEYRNFSRKARIHHGHAHTARDVDRTWRFDLLPAVPHMARSNRTLLVVGLLSGAAWVYVSLLAIPEGDPLGYYAALDLPIGEAASNLLHCLLTACLRSTPLRNW